MNEERIKEIMTNFGMPDSTSLYVALCQVINETTQSVDHEWQMKFDEFMENMKTEIRIITQDVKDLVELRDTLETECLEAQDIIYEQFITIKTLSAMLVSG